MSHEVRKDHGRELPSNHQADVPNGEGSLEANTSNVASNADVDVDDDQHPVLDTAGTGVRSGGAVGSNSGNDSVHSGSVLELHATEVKEEISSMPCSEQPHESPHSFLHDGLDHDDTGDEESYLEYLKLWAGKDEVITRFRRVNACMDAWPRSTAIIIRIMIPLWLLACIALLFGTMVAQFEAPVEYEQNDGVCAEWFVTGDVQLDNTSHLVYDMPTLCMDYYLHTKNNRSTYEGRPELALWIAIMASNGVSFPPIEIGFENASINSTLMELGDYMEICEEVSERVLYNLNLVNNTQRGNSTPVVCSELTFNWIRCWNSTVYGGMNPYRATNEQIVASDNQSEYYYEVWKQDQARLYDQYMSEYNCADTDLKCIGLAMNQSVAEATGSWSCSNNVGGSSWFWFTVMTTIGYGNQAPVTFGGRGLGFGVGWLCVVLFGGVSWLAGEVIGILVDDFFRKAGLKDLARPITGALFWAAVSIGWLFLIAYAAFEFWTDRVPDLVVDQDDSIWFAYITSLTVGLGDYYLQPEVMFVADVFKWSLLVLFGIAMLATFLGKVGGIFAGCLPDYGQNLKRRLAHTDLFQMKINEYQEREMLGLKAISEIVKLMDANASRRVDNTIRKKEILILLLDQTERELDYFSSQGVNVPSSSRDLQKLVLEERILTRLLKSTTEERTLLENEHNRVSAECLPGDTT